jgi:CNT family concentrative nucleoside transporter
MSRFAGVLGILGILGICWLMSRNRRAVPWRTVAWGLGLQLAFALLILRTVPGRWMFEGARTLVLRLLSFADVGGVFLFGNLYRGTPEIVESLPPGEVTGYVQIVDSASGDLVKLGLIIAVHILPTIIFFSSLTSVLYHLGIMQRLVGGAAWIMARTMKTSGSETLCAAANIFVGMTEAPLLIRPFVRGLTRSELMAVMVAGLATVAGGVMAVYVRFGIDPGHLLTASVMSAPAALTLAKIVVPETEASQTAGKVKLAVEKETVNVIDAAASGALFGLRLAANVGAMLLAFVGLIALVDFLLLGISGPLAGPVPALEGLSLSRIFGWIFSPLAWLIGVPWGDVTKVGGLIGTKIAVNEFLAYAQLSGIKDVISEKAFVIATYALCGFANFGSIAITIGGIGAIAPERRADLARFGLKAMIVAVLASALTASLAGILIG